MKKLGVISGLLAVLVLLGSCGQPGPAAGTVSSVSIDQSDSAIEIGGSLALSVTVTASGGADESVTWSSGDATVATVSDAGVVTAVAVGNATITATSVFNPTRSDSIVVSVTPAPTGPEVLWTRQFGTAAHDTASGVAVDADGNVMVAGTRYGVSDGVSIGDSDATLRKFSSAGELLWAIDFGTDKDDFATAVAVDADGDVVVVGNTRGDLEWLPSGENDAFVRKYDGANGAELWTSPIDLAGGTFATAVAVDSDGNVLIAGRTFGDFDDESAGWAVSAAFLSKYDSDGGTLWNRQISETVMALAVAVDAEGNIVAVGDMEGSTLEGDGVFVRLFDESGEVLWTSLFGTDLGERASAVAVDAEGNIVVAGYTDAVITGAGFAFVRKYDSEGELLWDRQFGSETKDDYALSLAVGADGRVVIAGYTLGVFGDASLGQADAFLHGYSSAGQEPWTRQFGTADNDFATGVAVAADGSVVVAGYTLGVLEGSSAGLNDGFIRKYAP